LILNYRLKPEDEDDDFDYEDEHVELESEKDEYDEDDDELEQPKASPLKPTKHEGASESPMGQGATDGDHAAQPPPPPKKRAPRKPPITADRLPPELSERVAPYRAGYTPAQRRDRSTARPLRRLLGKILPRRTADESGQQVKSGVEQRAAVLSPCSIAAAHPLWQAY